MLPELSQVGELLRLVRMRRSLVHVNSHETQLTRTDLSRQRGGRICLDHDKHGNELGNTILPVDVILYQYKLYSSHPVCHAT